MTRRDRRAISSLTPTRMAWTISWWVRRALRAEVFDENVESVGQEAEGTLSEIDATDVGDGEDVDASKAMEEPQEGEE